MKNTELADEITELKQLTEFMLECMYTELVDSQQFENDYTLGLLAIKRILTDKFDRLIESR